MTREFKHIEIAELEVKETDDGTRTVEGFASVFNNVDSYKDIVVPGAFARTLKENSRPAMLWQHDTCQVIGTWDELEETSKGLRVKGTILDTTLGNDVYKIVKAKAVTGMSIGYGCKKYEIDEKKGIRKLIDVDLFEVSLVTFPANDKAQITRVKSLDGVQVENLHEHKRMIEAALRDAGASNSVADYVASLVPTPALRDAGGELSAKLSNLFNQFTA